MFIARVVFVFTLSYSPYRSLQLQRGQTSTDIMAVTPTRIVSFFVNLIDEQIEQLGNHLADDVVLYWYGRTLKGKELVLTFLSEEIASPEHNLTTAKSIPEIHYRDVPSTSSGSSMKVKEDACSPVTSAEVGLQSSDCGSEHDDLSFQPLDSSLVHNTPDIKMSEQQRKALLLKPKKRRLFPCPSSSFSNGHTSFLEAKGSVSFHRIGRYGYRRPWHRECTLQLAYSCPPLGVDPVSCCVFSVIIYSDEMKCRRNLVKVFEDMKIVGGNLED